MEKIFSCGSSSASHTYGNVSSAIKELLLSKFPNDFFNYVHISTEMSFRSNRKLNKEMELAKRKKPFLLIKPTYEPVDDSVFGNQTALTRSMVDIGAGISRNTITPFIHDKKSGAKLAYRMNRDRITFEVTVRQETLHAQLDVYKNIQNMITWDRTYVVPVSLETMIPRSLIVYMSKYMGIDITDKNNIPSFLYHVQSLSTFPITYKIRNSSSSDEFFMYYKHGMYVTFADLSIDEGERRNMAEDNFNITFRVTAEFNFPAVFILLCDPKENHTFKVDAVVSTGSSSEIIPLFTFDKLFNPEYLTSDGYRQYTSFIFSTDKENDDKVDKTDMADLIDKDIQYVIRDQASKGIDPSMCIRAIVIKNNEEIREGDDWVVDWDNFTLSVLNSDSSATYRVILYVNLSFVNNEIADKLCDDITFDSIK